MFDYTYILCYHTFEVKHMSDINFDANNFHIPRWNELPNIDLYMDQVLNYIESCLKDCIKVESNEKIITKTMINNYVKQEIIEPPINKKYNKLHIAELFVICILKQVYSISEVKSLIKIALEVNSIASSGAVVLLSKLIKVSAVRYAYALSKKGCNFSNSLLILCSLQKISCPNRYDLSRRFKFLFVIKCSLCRC